ncbi:hypothetical protein [Paenibacillus uliginis]|uniref:hypothetical protein n=1 Tax=Paenibacillus uliginis TaxID=683737 RepID=UPI001AEC8122|nr:hypothetical protein [Paenibacillus uliginis]
MGSLDGRADVTSEEMAQLWPCEAVCEVMEEMTSTEVGKGFYIEVVYSRAVHWRGEGGQQERELAAKYHTLAYCRGTITWSH